MITFLGLLVAIVVAVSSSGSSRELTPSRAAETLRASAATLRFAGVHPIRLRGGAFEPGEHVRIRIRTGRKLLRRQVTSGRAGGFVVQVRLAADPCLGAFAQAIGDRGSRAAAVSGLGGCPPGEGSTRE
jgi:hypothetical protein